jgi:nucleotide-binding universal stress UspA family protein
MTNTQDIEAPIATRYEPTGSVRRNRFPIRIERILVPTDLTAESERAIEYGFVLAQCFGAHLTLLHVCIEPCSAEYMRGSHVREAIVEERMYFKNKLQSIAEEIKKHYAQCNTEFRDGVPCDEIVKTAGEENIDLVVISTHYYNWLTRLAYGCDGEQVLRHALCPILVLPAKKDE